MKKEIEDKLKNSELHEALEQEKLVESVKDEFKKRQEERKPFEAQWQLNMNFVMGNQYCAVTSRGEVEEYQKQFFWQEREVFNHLATLVETRLSKLSSLRPVLGVVPASDDERDVKTAALSKKILRSVSNKINLSDIISSATKWSETCGTAFYKVVWNGALGRVVAKTENGALRDGDVEISVCSPFEIYPDSMTRADIDECESLIHAKAISAKLVREAWGKDVKSETLKVFALGASQGIGGLGYSTAANKITDAEIEDAVLVIERYEKPSKERENGRLTIIAGDTLLYDGDLPYQNGKDKTRIFPFIRQVCIPQAGSFWGASVVERTIPVQRAYNAVKNRKHEFLNRISMGVLNVEDGSVDIDNLEDEGLSPGKILVYRQGSNPPSFMASPHVPTDFTLEEERLLNEFEKISGVSDLLHNSSIYSQNISGTALSLLMEQDQSRISCTTDSLKLSIIRLGECILRLYKQFAIIPKLLKVVGDNGDVEMFYFSSADITSDEVVLETDTELGQSLAQRRNMIFELLSRGLLSDQDGKLTNRMKSKVLEMLGFGLWEGGQDMNELHIKKAQDENLKIMRGEKVKVLEVDDHDLHINEHIAFMLGGEYKKHEGDEKIEENFLKHIRTHKQMRQVINQIENTDKE